MEKNLPSTPAGYIYCVAPGRMELRSEEESVFISPVLDDCVARRDELEETEPAVSHKPCARCPVQKWTCVEMFGSVLCSRELSRYFNRA